MDLIQTKEFIKNHLLNEVDLNNQLLSKMKNGSLDKRECFCFDLKHFCYEVTQQPFYLFSNGLSFVKEYGLSFNSANGWFCMNNDIGKGKFIPANYLFKKAPCDPKNCHKCSYIFALGYKLDEVSIKSGLLNPFNIGDGFLHSVCEFKYKNNLYVFDGANFLVMSKSLYNKVFNFKEIETITQNTIIKDFKDISYNKDKPLLKSEKTYIMGTPIKFNKTLLSKFSGLGFCLYLYNRNDFMKTNSIENENFYENLKKEYQSFERTLKKKEKGSFNENNY